MYDQSLLQGSCLPLLPFQVYVNSFFALLNARYYLQPDADANNSNDLHFHQGMDQPEVHIMVSPNEELQASRMNISTVKWGVPLDHGWYCYVTVE